MEFASRASLEEAIDVCSSRVRSLQECVRNKSDSGITLEHVAEEVKRLVVLRKELQLWKAKEEEEEEAAEAAAAKEAAENNNDSYTDSSGDENNNAPSPMKRKRKNKGIINKNDKTPLGPEVEEPQAEATITEQTDKDDSSYASGKDVDDHAKLVRRTHRVAKWLTDSDARLADLEAEVAKLERTKHTMAYLQKQFQVHMQKQREEKVESAPTEPKEEKRILPKKKKTSGQATKNEVTTLQKELAEEQSKLHGVVAVNETLVEKERQLRMEQANLVKTVRQLHEEKSKLVKKVHFVAESELSFRENVSELEFEIEEMEESLRENQEALKQTEKELDEERAARKSILEEYSQLEAEAHAIRTELEGVHATTAYYQARTEKLVIDLAATKQELETSLARTLALDARITTLETEKDTLVAHLASVESSWKLSLEQLTVTEEKLMQAQENAEEIILQRDTLLAQAREQERIHEEEMSKMTVKIAELGTSGSDATATINELELKLLEAGKSIELMLLEREESSRHILKLKDEVMAMRLSSEKALEQAFASTSQVKHVTSELATAKANLLEVTKQCEILSAQRTQNEALIANLRVTVISQEEMLKKTRTAMLEANEELKSSHSHTQKWKSSFQKANTSLNEKIAELDSSRKQLAKVRSELAASNASRKQLMDSSKEKDKKIGKINQELATLREQLENADKIRIELEKERQSLESTVQAISAEKTKALVLAAQAQKYRQILVGFIPLVVAVILYVIFN